MKLIQRGASVLAGDAECLMALSQRLLERLRDFTRLRRRAEAPGSTEKTSACMQIRAPSPAWRGRR